MAGKAKPKEFPTVVSLVREVWEANDGDMPAASEALFARLTADQAMLATILPSVLKTWCREQIDHHIGRLRIAALEPVNDPSRGGRLRSVITASLFDFPLPGGKRLGDANAADIREGAASYGRAAADSAHKQHWLEAVADRVGRHNRAEKALTLEQLTELYEEARGGEET